MMTRPSGNSPGVKSTTDQRGILMPRKKDITDAAAENQTTGAATAVAEPAPATESQAGTEDGQTPGKNWGPAYKAIFSCTSKGFEMGEDRRFKQRLFKF